MTKWAGARMCGGLFSLLWLAGCLGELVSGIASAQDEIEGLFGDSGTETSDSERDHDKDGGGGMSTGDTQPVDTGEAWSSEGSSTDAATTEPSLDESTGDPCRTDRDDDRICDADDLCNDARGTHCFEVGGSRGVLLELLLDRETGVFDPLFQLRVRVGLTLDVMGLTDHREGGCSTVDPNDVARTIDARVLEVRVLVDDDVGQQRVDETIVQAWAEELESSFAWMGEAGNEPRFRSAIFPAFDPEYLLTVDSVAFSPGCDQMNLDRTMSGDDAVLRMYRGYVDGDRTIASDRIAGRNGHWELRPHG